jgi:hypothetical protein
VQTDAKLLGRAVAPLDGLGLLLRVTQGGGVVPFGAVVVQRLAGQQDERLKVLFRQARGMPYPCNPGPAM